MTAERGASAKRGGTLGVIAKTGVSASGTVYQIAGTLVATCPEPGGRAMTAERGAPAKRAERWVRETGQSASGTLSEQVSRIVFDTGFPSQGRKFLLVAPFLVMFALRRDVMEHCLPV
jgi:hypothetical protein